MSLNKIISRLLVTTGTAWLRWRLHAAKSCTIGSGLTSKGIPMVRVNKTARIAIGKDFRINNGERFNAIGRQTRCIFIVRNEAELIIGHQTGISSSTIFCAHRVVIGNHVKIGGNTCIYDTDFHSLDYEYRRDRKLDGEHTRSREVRIGNDVFIGAHTTILKGVTIGDRSIVGAGSVVTRSIPADEIWGGNPAVFIRKINTQNTAVLQAI